MSVRCMNALYRWQTLQGSALSQAIGEAQMRFELANVREEFIMDLNTQIEALETQVQERDNLLVQCNGKLTLLEQQFNALQNQLDDALDHIEVLEAQQAQPEAMEEEPQEVQGVSGLDTAREFPCHHLRELTPPLEASRPSTTLTTFR